MRTVLGPRRSWAIRYGPATMRTVLGPRRSWAIRYGPNGLSGATEKDG
jgi:hypothetical protein